ncbi:hypothetical protein K8352_02295 [Flavobacteriaceae bacterium F89]|uniref:Uncharacterized protein n=1 Tax=Cerina litoralis TaxID=2874477 RepID=A0AAE3ESV8_9FLAO|nr:hypothetical protein [Cerina litoralis]MCG2459574.1 hypothetical protein [Cerina litoralis]
MKKYILIVLMAIAYFSCSRDKEPAVPPKLLDAITSSSIAFKYSGGELQNFFQNPTQAYVSGYFYFEPDLADDIIFGFDVEWSEGVDNPIHFPGADWMSLAGFTRDGVLRFPMGSPKNLNGTPTNTDKWLERDTGIPLQPNQWYKMTVTGNFQSREFLSVRLQGNGNDIVENLEGIQLEYPNYIPLDKPSLTFYCLALRAKEFAPTNEGGTKVYFDDIEGGISVGSDYKIVFSDGFENQSTIQEIPITLPVSPLDDIEEGNWYFENEEAKIKINSNIKRNGLRSLECNASLEK